MKKDTEYVAQFKTPKQVSPDDWQVMTPSMKVNGDTTIQDIIDWAKDVHRDPCVMEFKLTLLE